MGNQTVSKSKTGFPIGLGRHIRRISSSVPAMGLNLIVHAGETTQKTKKLPETIDFGGFLFWPEWSYRTFSESKSSQWFLVVSKLKLI